MPSDVAKFNILCWWSGGTKTSLCWKTAASSRRKINSRWRSGGRRFLTKICSITRRFRVGFASRGIKTTRTGCATFLSISHEISSLYIKASWQFALQVERLCYGMKGGKTLKVMRQCRIVIMKKHWKSFLLQQRRWIQLQHNHPVIQAATALVLEGRRRISCEPGFFVAASGTFRFHKACRCAASFIASWLPARLTKETCVCGFAKAGTQPRRLEGPRYCIL